MRSDSLQSTILLVEDDPIVREVTAQTLRDAGYVVAEAPDGEAAFQVLHSVRPDLILSDVRMPVSSGLDLLRRVRSSSPYVLTPFIFMSARAETADQRKGMSEGADDYVTKPYLPDDLLKTIKVRLNRSAMLNDRICRQQKFLSRTLPHELRTPVSSVIGYADLMSEMGQNGESLSPGELIEYGRDLQTAGKRLMKSVDNFALWSWLEQQFEVKRSGNPVALAQRAVSIIELETSIQETVEQYARKHDVMLDVQPATLTVPSEGLVCVIRHIVDNALKFSLAGSLVQITGVLQGAYYEISVRDQGRGMAEHEIDNVGMLRQFRREQYEQQGMGIGLALAGSFARLAAGEFALIRNCPDPGLTVRLVLPAAMASLAK